MNSRRVIAFGLVAWVLGVPAWAATKGVIQIKSPKTFPFVINQPGSYQLIGNLTAPPSVPAIQIDASNVTLDLNGFAVQRATNGSGTSASGIVATNTDQLNITVKNGVVQGFNGSGVDLSGLGHVVTDVRAEGNGFSGIHVAAYSSIEHCTVTSNGATGIVTDVACSLKDNVSIGNGGTGIKAGQLCTLVQNTCNVNGVNGIQMDQSSAASQNNCSGNNSNGIVGTGGKNSIVGNTCLLNGTAGLDLGSVGGNYAAQNKLGGNTTAIVNSGGNTVGAGDLANVTF